MPSKVPWILTKQDCQRANMIIWTSTYHWLSVYSNSYMVFSPHLDNPSLSAKVSVTSCKNNKLRWFLFKGAPNLRQNFSGNWTNVFNPPCSVACHCKTRQNEETPQTNVVWQIRLGENLWWWRKVLWLVIWPHIKLFVYFEAKFLTSMF